MASISQNEELIKHLMTLIVKHRRIFKQERVYQRAKALIFAEIFAFARHTITQLIMTLGMGEHDWNAWYRIFSAKRFNYDKASEVFFEQTLHHVDDDEVYVVGGDATQTPRSSRKMEGSGWLRNLRTPPFMVGIHAAQRWFNGSGPFLRKGVANRPLMLIVVRGKQRTDKHGRVYRRGPLPFLVNAVQDTDGQWVLPLPIETLLFWAWQRWELEVCHRELKSNFGLGNKQCFTPHSAVLSVQWSAWVYSLLLLAGLPFGIVGAWGIFAALYPNTARLGRKRGAFAGVEQCRSRFSPILALRSLVFDIFQITFTPQFILVGF